MTTTFGGLLFCTERISRHLARDANINRILEKVKNDLNISNPLSELEKKDRKVPDLKTLASEHFTNLRKEVLSSRTLETSR